MARISDLNSFNSHRKELMKVKTADDNTILFTREEARAALIKYIEDELDLFVGEIGVNVKKRMIEELNVKIKGIEGVLLNHINNKFNDLTEKIVVATIDKEVEKEVDKRLNIKLEKLKKLL